MTSPDSPTATARAAVPAAERETFDRLVQAVTGAGSKPLGVVLRSLLPGVEGVRWLGAEGLPASTRAGALTSAQWVSLHSTGQRLAGAAHDGPGRRGGRASVTEGQTPGGQAAPRWS
jgi:hypothetical protein